MENSAAVQNIKVGFPRVNKSTVNKFKKEYNIEHRNTVIKITEKCRYPLPKHSFQSGCLLLLPDLNSVV